MQAWARTSSFWPSLACAAAIVAPTSAARQEERPRMAEMRSSAAEIARAQAEVLAERVREVAGRSEAAASCDVGHGLVGLCRCRRRGSQDRVGQLEAAGQDMPGYGCADGGEHTGKLAPADPGRGRHLVGAQSPAGEVF